MNTPPIVIAGGGIAGLAAALSLGRHDVNVLEKAPVFSEVGAGVQLGPNAVRALQKLGAWDAVEPITTSPPDILIRDGSTGRTLKRLPLGKDFENRFGAPYRVAHRADLHSALLEVVKSRANITCHLGSGIDDIALHLDTVAYHSKNSWYSTPYLVAADGVQSLIRQTLFPGTAAIASGHVLHRALVAPSPTADEELCCVNLWMYPAGHVVHYPVGRDRRLNIVAVTPTGFLPADHFAEASSVLRQTLDSANQSFSPWSGLFVPPLQNWTKGNVLLVGDAAHATLPYLAQGAAMAIEDAASLAAAVSTTHRLRDAFAEIATRRVGRTSRIQAASMVNGKRYHMDGVLRQIRNAAIKSMPVATMRNQLAWIYDYSVEC